MATTLGSLWVNRNSPTQIRWWNPPERSSDGFNVHYKEGDPLDWDKAEFSIGRGNNTEVDQVELRGPEGTIVVALKKFRTHGGNSTRRVIEEIENEVKAIRRLRHIHVVEAVGSVSYPRTVGFFMRPRAEFNLLDLLSGLPDDQERRKELEKAVWKKDLPDFLVSTIGCLAHGLMYIHSHNIKHKDIKPNNILVDKDRVAFADFGISRSCDEHSTTSSGPTGQTRIYAPIEVLNSHNGAERSRSQDIFSLGCCFAEIFAVYKGRNLDDIRACWGEYAEQQSTNSYAYHISAVLAWIKRELVVERCDIQLWNLLREMFATDRKMRPPAKRIWEEAVTLSSQKAAVHFCGGCCVPIIPDTINPPERIPAAHNYVYGSPSVDWKRKRPASSKALFSIQYDRSEIAPYWWQRNLRLSNQAGVDGVEFRGTPLLARKIIWPKNDTEPERRKALEAAEAEAKILQRLHEPEGHHHLVKLHGTYRQHQNLVILIDPLADFDLKTYLALVEQPHAEFDRLKNVGDVKSLLRISFGCLANALTHIHSKNIVHGDLSSRNILVLPQASQKMYIAEFGKAAYQESQRNILSTFHAADEDESTYMDDNAYTAPEAPRPQLHAPSEDIFALGCVFVEIETVRKGLSLQEMRDFLAESPSAGDAVKVRYGDPSVINRLPLWIRKLESEHSTLSTLADLLCEMVASKATSRPRSVDVLEKIRRCNEADGPLCGKFCLVD